MTRTRIDVYSPRVFLVCINILKKNQVNRLHDPPFRSAGESAILDGFVGQHTVPQGHDEVEMSSRTAIASPSRKPRRGIWLLIGG